jgi:AcrR family transcriptional regulator
MAHDHGDAGAHFNELRRRMREHLDDQHGPEVKGLRERKKDLMRERISDTATRMFLERGFDAVRVADVAAACDVSEKTIYNYFPTKESLLLDREEESIRDIEEALGPNGAHTSPVDAVVAILTRELDEMVEVLSGDDGEDRQLFLRFNDLIESTPGLKAYRVDMMDRIAQVAATALAARAAVDPMDPEPQIAADTLMSLWRIYFQALLKHASTSLTPVEIRSAVLSDVRRAARLIDTGLWSFATVVQGAKGRQQFQAAADASDEARKQVIRALKEARNAWRQMKLEHEATTRNDVIAQRRSLHSLQAEAREIKRQTTIQRQELRKEIKDAVKRAQKPHQ